MDSAHEAMVSTCTSLSSCGMISKIRFILDPIVGHLILLVNRVIQLASIFRIPNW